MKWIDLVSMSGNSLLKRKVRTTLTVLGVVIGVAAIVVMVSLGLGLSRSLVKQYESYGSLTQITVQQRMDSNDKDVKYLNDELIGKIRQMEHVESVYPVLDISVLARCGRYQAYLQVQGLPKEAFESMSSRIRVGRGRLPGQDNKLSFFYGSTVLQNFTNVKGDGGGYWENGVFPEINLMKDPVFMIFDMDAYYQSQGNNEGTQRVKAPKKYLIPACGMEQASAEGSTQYSWMTYCDIELLKTELKKIFKKKVIPGQPTTSKGKPLRDIVYNQLYVNVDSMDHVVELQKQIADMGYEAYSNAEWLESQQKTMGYVKAVLGGIGAVSLLIAAIGITNTMMMSIYERTKEIGVMKVLGCGLGNIRTMFLMEAGFIGLIGGMIGVLVSLAISLVINKVVSGINDYMADISYIPVWLALVSVLFAVLVGMTAGFFPARRAMKLSPLAAIRNE